MQKRIILLVLVILMVTSLVFLPQADNQQYSEQFTNVEITLSSNNEKTPRAEIEIYNLDTLECVLKSYSDFDGLVSIDLSPGNYIANAATQFDVVGIGCIGSVEFAVEADISLLSVVLPMRLKSDHSTSIKIGPSSESEYPTGLVEIALVGSEYNVPLLMPSQNSLLEIDELQVSLDSDETIWISPPYYYGIVETTTSYDEWHPIALIDSENGLSHELKMSYYDTESMTIESEIKYSGVTYSHSYSTSFSYSHGDETSIICSNGQSKSRLSEFKHIYETGSLYMLLPTGYNGALEPEHRGYFQREWVDEWYTMSYDIQTGWAAGISETREIYRGTWISSTSSWISMSSSSSMSLGFAVSRGDVFGASVKIQTSIDHSTQANHRLVWTQPTSTAQLKIFSGNLFDQ